MSDSSSSEQRATGRENVSSRELALRKYEARMGLLKVIVGTALVGLAGVFVPAAVEFWKSHYENERKRLEIAVSQQSSHQQFVQGFISTALAQDIELRIRFAEYFSTVSDNTHKEDWKAYLDILSKKRSDIRSEINILESEVRTLLPKGKDLTPPEQISRAEKERRLEWAYKELGYLQPDRSIVPSASEVKTLARDTRTSRNSPNPHDFLIFVSRTRVERRANHPYARTVGSYHVTFHGQRLRGLEGGTAERSGPGDNSVHGDAADRRIEAGTYPLFTHGGTRFVTIGYAPDPKPAERPWPAIRIEETGDRQAIMIHPGQGYLTSIGAVNLSKPLSGPDADIDFPDSRQKVIALIDAMKEKLGVNFPSANGMRIPNAWIVITGEPLEPASN